MYGMHGIIYMVLMACTNGRYDMHGMWGLCGSHIRRHVWHACMYVRMHACMYVCMYIGMSVYMV